MTSPAIGTQQAKTNCSTDTAREEELQHIKKVLSVSGYQKWVWDIPGDKKTIPHPSTQRQTPSRGHVSMPYLSRKIRKLGVSVHAKPTNTIRSQLVHHKDKTDKLDTSGLIYQIDCQDCDQSYIGETERNLHIRLEEHKRESSLVGEHLTHNQHHFVKDNLQVLDKEAR
ncbi:uncharacterized protein LOC143290314 [Babylonia areolata]|uniref:uncharacterized protein LOC143290314 n=1 Tax=Babylonia areolata TaxID=304850 RepID=UPI003FD0452C